MTRSSRKMALGLALVLVAGLVLSLPGSVRAQSGETEQALPEPVRLRVEALLKGAELDLANGRLGGTGKDNAISKYQEVETLDPGNKEADAGLKRIARKALGLCGDALALDDHVQAAEFLAIANQAGADSKKAARLEKKIKPPKPRKKTQAEGDKKEAASDQAQASAPEDRTAEDMAEAQAQKNLEYVRLLTGERHIRQALEAVLDGDREAVRYNLEQARRLIPEDPGLDRLELRLHNMEGDRVRQAEQKLEKADKLIAAGQTLEAESLVDEASQTLGWGGRVAQLKNRLRELKPEPEPEDKSGPEGALTNSIGMTFNLVPAGSFVMGSDLEAFNRNDEMPKHEVDITKPFYLGVAEVTQAQWKEVMGDNPSRFKDEDGLRPVERVTFEQVDEFLKKLNEIDSSLFHRLPTEAEWEYASRAGTETPFSFGEDPKDLVEYGWYMGNAGFRTQRVAQKEANPWGFFDLHGNVWELCSDWYDPSYYQYSPKEDPKGPEKGEKRVMRGGCFLDGSDTLRSATRAAFSPGFRAGLRIVAETR